MSRRRLSVVWWFVVAVPSGGAIVHVLLTVVVAFLPVAVSTVMSRTVDIGRTGVVSVLGLSSAVVVSV